MRSTFDPNESLPKLLATTQKRYKELVCGIWKRVSERREVKTLMICAIGGGLYPVIFLLSVRIAE